MDWLERYWMYTGVVAGLFLPLLVPLLVGGWNLPLLVYLQLPIYLLHQIEEHYDDRFRRFVNGASISSRSILRISSIWGSD